MEKIIAWTALQDILSVLRRAEKLEVVIIHLEQHLTNLNYFFTMLSTLPFLSNFHSLILTGREDEDEDFVISQTVLDYFLLKVLSAPCKHPQSIKFRRIIVDDFMLDHFITGSRLPTSPFWEAKLQPEDRSYLHLKSIEFEEPRFILKIPANVLSSWSGQSVTCQSDQDENWFESFVISFPNMHKRPRIEWIWSLLPQPPVTVLFYIVFESIIKELRCDL